jgi:hypothetical protein
MSNIAIQGAATGTGVFTLASPATNTDRTLTLPDEAGTVLTNSSDIPAANLTGSLPAGMGGKVLQIVQATTTLSTPTTSATFVALDGMTASITPTSVTSKILVLMNMVMYTSSGNTEAIMTIYRNGSDLSTGTGFSDSYAGSTDLIVPHSISYVDSPATTSSTTYAGYFKRNQGSTGVTANLRGATATVILMEIAA